MLIAVLLALAGAQDAPTVANPEKTADGSQRWSILADPCASARTGPEDVVVCGKRAETSPRLPLPGERGPPERAIPSNPEVTGMRALEVQNAPCATRSQGCTTGVDIFGMGTSVIRGIGMLIDPDSCCEEPGESTNVVMLGRDVVNGVGRMFRKKPDKSNRVPIPLDDPAPVAAKPAQAPAP